MIMYEYLTGDYPIVILDYHYILFQEYFSSLNEKFIEKLNSGNYFVRINKYNFIEQGPKKLMKLLKILLLKCKICIIEIFVGLDPD